MSDNRKIGFYCGGFKPVHKGHWEAILTASRQCDEVYLVVSSADRRRKDELPILHDTMRHLWDKYIHNFLPENVFFEFSNEPVKTVMEMVGGLNWTAHNNKEDANEIIIFGDKKDLNKIWGDFSKLETVCGVLAKLDRIKLFYTDRICSGTQVREAIINGQKDLVVNTLLPKQWSKRVRNYVYDRLDPSQDLTGKIARFTKETLTSKTAFINKRPHVSQKWVDLDYDTLSTLRDVEELYNRDARFICTKRTYSKIYPIELVEIFYDGQYYVIDREDVELA